MAIVAAWYAENNSGDDILVVMLGRRSSTELNVISYDGRTNWTPSETAWASTADASGNLIADAVTIRLTINSQVQTVVIPSPDTDSARMLRAFTLPDLEGGIHYPYTLEITSGAASGVYTRVEGRITKASATQVRYALTACFGNAINNNALGEDLSAEWGYGGSTYNYVTSGITPIAGAGAFITGRIADNDVTHWVNVDDGVYLSLLGTNGTDDAPPRTLTDTSDDTPVTLTQLRNLSYTDAVVNASVDRNATASAQMAYFWYEWSMRRRDVFNLCLTGPKYFRMWGDNDCWNNWDHSWWLWQKTAMSGLTTPAGDPETTATFNPADFSNSTNANCQIEANTYWRFIRGVYQMYFGDHMPAPESTTPQVPWVVRELQGSANADPNHSDSDYIPYTFSFNDGLGDTVVLDFLTCPDLTPIDGQNYIGLNAGNTHWLNGSGGNLRVVESILGEANDSAFKALITGSSSAPLVLSPKQFGSIGDGNIDDNWTKNPNWTQDWYNTVIASSTNPVLTFAGDHHCPSVISNAETVQIGVAPASWAGLADIPDTGEAFSDISINITGVTDSLSNNTVSPTWTLDNSTTGVDRARSVFGLAYRTSGGLYGTAYDHRGGKVAENYLFTSSISAGVTFPSIEVNQMARDTIEAAKGVSSNGRFSGCGVASESSGLFRGGGNVYLPLRRTDGTTACVITGALNRKTGPTANRGPVVTVVVGEGDITADASGNAAQIAELPSGMTVANGGYTFTLADTTTIDDRAVNGVTYRSFRIARGADATIHFGLSETALDPIVGRWVASETGLANGDRRASTDPDVELRLDTAGSGLTAGTTEPPIDGAYGTTVSDGTLNWEQVPSSDTASFDVTWTDPTASSGGSGGGSILEGLIDQNLLTDDNILLRA